MSKSHSTRATKPSKPYPDFPLTAHPVGQWCKKIRGKIHYFGPWDDPDQALNNYLARKDDLHAGRTPRPDSDAATVKDVVNAFLNAKKDKLDSGELSPRTWQGYKEITDLLVKYLGKGRLAADLHPDDFARASQEGCEEMGRAWTVSFRAGRALRLQTCFRVPAD